MESGIEAPEDVLLDLDLRFISSAPKDSLSSPEHLAFLVEHWWVINTCTRNNMLSMSSHYHLPPHACHVLRLSYWFYEGMSICKLTQMTLSVE